MFCSFKVNDNVEFNVGFKAGETMVKSGFDYAQEEIRKVLVQEYIRNHPGVREQDVVIACKDGKLVFTQISEVLADTELRKQSGSIFLQANRMFSELAVHHDDRWKECVQSSQHCLQMIDCLHSSIFKHFSDLEWLRYQNLIKKIEGICATKTVQLHEATQKLAALDAEDASKPSLRTKSLVIDYLVLVIDQCKSLLAVFNQEMKIGDLFLNRAKEYMSLHDEWDLQGILAFSIEETRKDLKGANVKQGGRRLRLDESYALNEKILIETKNALLHAIQDVKKKLDKRRKRIHDVWTAVSSMEETVSDIGQTNAHLTEKKTPLQNEDESTSPAAFQASMGFQQRMKPEKNKPKFNN